jgi:cytochrome c-type biogenesis protein CcmH/NrfG
VADRKWDEAVDFLKKAIEIYPFDHELKLVYGRALVGSGELEAGKVSIQEATELKDLFLKFSDLHHEATKYPADAKIRVRLGQLAEKLGKIELAKTWYRAANGLDPQNQEAAQSLSRLK